ncbi:MAG: condensation domain-containing protein, partial [Ruminiclostridium sp.]
EDDPPYWKLLENISMINFCSLEETKDMDQTIQDFIQRPIDIDNGPMVNVRLIRSEKYDVLGVKINHACCDGAGVLEYVQLLANIYTNIDQENGTFIPIPRIGGRKDQDKLFAELGITNPDPIFIPGSDILVPMWSFPWEQSGSNNACMSVCRLPYGYLDSMSKFAKSRGATVNDFILAAYYRAMLDMSQPIYGIPMEIPITIDLRRYLPGHKAQAIRNFSGSVSTRLIMSINEPFSETLQRVVNMMKEIKNGYPGLQSAIGLERIEKISFQETLAYYQAVSDAKKPQLSCPLYCGDKCVPTLSNLGHISKFLIKFGDNTVIDAYVLPPVVRAPGLLLMASTYNSVLTLAAGYYKSTVDRENIERLLNNIRDELIEGCKS